MGFFTITPATDRNDVIFDQDFTLIDDSAIAPQSARDYAQSLADMPADLKHIRRMRNIIIDLGHGTSLWTTHNVDPTNPTAEETELARQIHTTLLQSPIDGSVTPQSGTRAITVTMRDLRFIRDAVELSVQNGAYTDTVLVQARALISVYDTLVLNADKDAILLYTCTVTDNNNA